MSHQLERFFGGRVTRPPPYFVLKRDPGKPYGLAVGFEEEKPADTVVVGTVRWKVGAVDILICGDHSFVEGAGFEPQDTGVYDVSHLKLLKSNLQKTIRRSLVGAAVACANTMLDLDVTQLVQRLAIVWIEDCCITTEFPLVVWCLAALTKGWTLTEEMARVIVSLAGRLAALEVHDVHGSKNERFPVARIAGLSDASHKSLLYALQFRRDFQCMSGDKRMIDRCVADWFSRFSSGTGLEVVLPPLALSEKECTQRMSSSTWCAAAVDQHCSSLCRRVAVATRLPEVDVKRAVWEKSSRLTNKKRWEKGREEPGETEGVEEVWAKIGSQVMAEALWTLARFLD